MRGNSWYLWVRRALPALSHPLEPKKARREGVPLRVERLESRTTPTTLTLGSVADDTIYQVSAADPSLQLSNGAGQHFYVGRTGQGANDIRRGALRFDLSAILAGATINSVTLTLHLSKTRNGAESILVHRALAAWGEGNSNAANNGHGGEGAGIQATTGDVTWFYTAFPSQRWTAPGGDFVATASATTSVSGVGTYQWTGTGLVADVQQWVSNPATDFGWIVTGNEGAADTSKQFDTKESNSATSRPVLTIDYTPPAADLAIAKSHTGDFRQGDAADTYTVIVSNVGPGATNGAVTVTDTLPAGLAATPADNGAQNGWSLSVSGQTITATRSDMLAGGASYPALTLTVSVGNSAPASVINTATVAGGGETNTANDSASDPTTIIAAAADLTISKSHTGSFKQGDAADTYTVTVSNGGAGPTTAAVTVTDTLPAGLTPTAADNGTVNGWTLTTTGQTITATRSDPLAPGSSYPALTVTVQVAVDAPASLTNTVTVAGGGEVNTDNDTASDLATITQVADLTISKSHSGTFRPGDGADVYTITVSNIGPVPTDGSLVTVTDTLPAGLTPTTADSGTVNGWTLSFTGQIVKATRQDVLASGAAYPALPITVSVANGIAAVVTNMATVSGGGEVNTANDTASDPTATTPVADLTLTLSHPGAFRQGQSGATYTLTVNNSGPGATTAAVTVTDTLPAGLTPTAADNGTVNGWTLTTTGQTITATRSDPLAPGSSYPALTVTVDISATAAATITNMATVAGGGEINTSNDTASDPTTITQVADLTVAKSHSGTFHPGDPADVYTITVRNLASVPTDGSRVTVTDSLPTGLTPTMADSGVINGWVVSFSGQVITATRSDVLGGGASYPVLTLTVAVSPAAAGSLTNTATVSGGGEINTSNDTASDVTQITQLPDLTLAINHGGSFTAGGTGQYTITVSNVGLAATNGAVLVLDTLPTGLTYTGPTTINDWKVAVSGQTVMATRTDSLANGGGYPALTLTVTVANPAPADFTNTATVSGGGEVNVSNDAATDVAGGQPPRRRGGDGSTGSALPVPVILATVGNALTHSAEYLGNLVLQDYLQLLHRTPSANEINAWVTVLQGGASTEQTLAGFASSPEYYQDVGSSDRAWLDALYQDLLGRAADSTGEASWLGRLSSGMSRFAIAAAFATSTEHEALLVTQFYQRYLGRTPAAAEVAGWVNNLGHGLTDEQLIAAFMASPEFFAVHGSSLSGWVVGAYQSVFQRTPDPFGFNYWESYLQQQLNGG